MAKKVLDITEKLSFDENPRLKIKEEEFELNGDAFSVLRLMQFSSIEEPSGKDVMGAIEALFVLEDLERLKKMKLQMGDLMQVLRAGMAAVTGKEPGENQGE